MSDKAYILCVDDEELNLVITTDLLEEFFEVGLAEDGQKCLDSVAHRKPELILLDVNMPVMNGLETCKKLRANPDTANIPILFVSALASSSGRLAGYEAGGDDYITKPFDEDELLAKINLFLKQKKEQQEKLQQHQKDKDFATNTAMMAITNSFEMGIVVQYMQSILTVDTLQQVIDLTFEAFIDFDISGCLRFSHLEDKIFASSDGIERPIERDILDEAHQKGRIIEFSGRAIFNTNYAAMLIRKMPLDVERCGRYKDHLVILIDALEAKLLLFQNVEKKLESHRNLATTITSIAGQLEHVNQAYQQQRSQNAAILGELGQQIENSFLTLGLDEVQEEALMTLINHAEHETDQVYEIGKESEDTFNQIVTDLNDLLTKD